MTLFQACYSLFILRSLGSPPPPTHREFPRQGYVLCFAPPQPAVQQVDVVENRMDQPVNQWVLMHFLLLIINYRPQPSFSSPLAPLKGPWAYPPSPHTLAHACNTHSFSAPSLAHLSTPDPPAPSSLRLQTLQSPEVLPLLGHMLLPGPGLHTQQTSGTCWWAAWVFWADMSGQDPQLPCATLPTALARAAAGLCLIPLSPLHTKHLPLTAHRPPAPGSEAS